MNFIEEFKKGQSGKNLGLPTGLKPLDRAIGGIQKKSIYCIAAAPKVGKTTLADMCFVIEPFLYFQKIKEEFPDSTLDIEWIYFSFEIDRVKKEFKYAAFFFFYDYGVADFWHKERLYQISPTYIEGKLIDKDDEVILMKPEHLDMLKEIYEKRIIPLFGEYDAEGRKIKRGFMEFIEQRDNPTGLRNHLLHYAKQHGSFVFEKYTTNDKGTVTEKQRIIGYKPTNPDKYTIIVTDHVRKLNKEMKYSLKENIDKWIEYSVELRNWCKFTFIHIVHLNRGLASIERIKFLTEFLHPTGDDIKDTGNISEEADYVITLFNPRDEKYKLSKHFGIELEGYPNYRSLHLVESRDTECPIHLPMNMYGNINLFQPI